jgi:carbon-monoxide dehydrogenase medium subunit
VRQFAYERPSDVPSTVALLAELGDQARILAGGTDLIIRLRDRALTPQVVVDVKRLPELAPSITDTDAGVRISAGTTMTDLVGSPMMQRSYPALVEAARIVGSVQIRNRATLAGNQCNASPAADTAPPLLVYGAVLTLAGPNGLRELPLNDFFVRSGVTRLERGELVTAITLPRPAPAGRSGSAFQRRTRRRGHDLASITFAVALDDAGTTRVAFGSVGPRPLLFVSESGDPPLEDWFAHAAPSPTSMRASPEYRMHMLRVLATRAFATARERMAAA